MTIFRIAGLCLLFIVFGYIVSSGQDENQKTPDQSPKTRRQIWIELKTGEIVTGDLVKVDLETIEFKVRNILQTVSLDKVSNISFVEPSNQPPTISLLGSISATRSGPIEPMTDELDTTILYKEKAKYTKDARDNNVQGVVVLNLVFTADGKITGIRVVRGLPDGLTEKAIEAAQKIRFNPATRDGQPISVRGNLEFSFQLGN